MPEHAPHLVPVREVPMREVHSFRQLKDSLRSTRSGRIPAFVMRASGLVDVDFTPPNIPTLVVIKALRAIGIVSRCTIEDTDRFALQPRRGTGPLHADGVFPEHVNVFNIHTTELDAGKVTAANSGSRMRAFFSVPSTDSLTPHMKRVVHREFQRETVAYSQVGQTDPQLMARTLHTAELSAGDRVIFPWANALGPVWHRFDTSSDTREATVAAVTFHEPVEGSLA